MCIAAMRMILPYPTLATSPQQTQYAYQNIYMKDINFKMLLILSLIDFFSNYLKRRVKWPEFLPPKFTRGWGEFDVRDENVETWIRFFSSWLQRQPRLQHRLHLLKKPLRPNDNNLGC